MLKCLPEFFNKITKKHLFFVVVLLIAAFLRFWNIPNTVQFLGDQGRDAMIVASIFKELDPVFIGPVTSVGNMYLGPLYYYFMVPFLMLTYPSPMGPVYVMALLGLSTVFLMYFLGKKILSERVAIIAATLFGLSTVVAENTRFSWNPNPAPLVSLLMIFFTHQALKKDSKYWMAVIICFAVLIQLHYLTLLSAAGFGLIWLYQIYQKVKNKKSIKKILNFTILGTLIFIISLTPLFLFDLKHDGLNRKALAGIFTKEKSFAQEDIKGIKSLTKLVDDVKNRTELILTEISIGKTSVFVDFIVGFLILTLVLHVLVSKYKKKKIYTGELVVSSFLVTGVLGTAAYQHNVYHHYIAYLFPVSFFATAIAIDFLLRKKVLGKLLVLIFFGFFIRFNFVHAKEILESASWTIGHTQAVAKTIEDRVQPGEKYNIVLLTRTGDIEGQNYRYFLSTSDKPPVDKIENDTVDTLFIINDDRILKKVVDSPAYEIVVFPNKVPSEVYEIENGPEITVLRRN
jgi:4-amino-4-deoxy-L-arabinose transferase-like glycosyltransferase